MSKRLERIPSPRGGENPKGIIDDYMVVPGDSSLLTGCCEGLEGGQHVSEAEGGRGGDGVEVPSVGGGDSRAGEEFEGGVAGGVGHVPGGVEDFGGGLEGEGEEGLVNVLNFGVQGGMVEERMERHRKPMSSSGSLHSPLLPPLQLHIKPFTHQMQDPLQPLRVQQQRHASIIPTPS